MVVSFIDSHKGRFGVVPICRVLSEHGCGIAPSTYYAHHDRPLSNRALRDAKLTLEVVRVQTEKRVGCGVYGAYKVWRQLHREGIMIARCTVERLMRQEGLVGVVRGARRRTRRSARAAVRPPDRVDRVFAAQAPNQLWVALVIDVYSRRIVGWRCASSMPTELPLDADAIASADSSTNTP